MPSVKFTQALKRFFPNLETQQIEGSSIAQILAALEEKHPGLNSYIITDQGQLRQHVNIFIDGNFIDDRENLTDPLKPGSEIYIMQALSGG